MKRALGGILDRLYGVVRPLVDSLRGRGYLVSSIGSGLERLVRRIQVQSYYRIRASDPDDLEQIADSARGSSLGSAEQAATELGLAGAVSDAIDPIANEVEEFVFEQASFDTPDSAVPDIQLPTPDQIQIPEFTASLDFPDEMVPWYIDRTLNLPDELTLHIDDTAISLPEVPLFDDLNEVIDESGLGIDGAAGIGTSLDASVEELEAELGSLTEQDAQTRDSVVTALTQGADDFSSLILDIYEGVDEFQEDVLNDAADLATRASTLSFVIAGALIVTGIGSLGLITVGMVAAQVALIISVTKAIIDLVQIAAGFGSLYVLDYINFAGTGSIMTTDLGGVSID
ncbi:hypothetical protein [Haloarchaeobius sp. HME9146]|uniref:hypothetical protein n=1 Tax=Haloarchaeobius sp. HME9146 TaxID=2978732 RepID=UPI0021BFCF4C|nr:hypothetical protein [Haloarchaeobius sp. HME9146]MCT9098205.1 hypothetical protein [Haloarchaeobius sp. HME9146]